MQAMNGDNPTFYLEASPNEGDSQIVRSPSEGSSEIESSSFDASMRLFPYAESQASLQAPVPTPVLMRLKPGNKKSFVWNYFRHPENESGMVDRTRTQCLLCKSQLAFNASGTTTTMLNHLKSRHGEVAQREESQRIRSGTSGKRKDNSTSRVSYSPLKAHQSPLQLPIPPPSQIPPSRMKHTNGFGDFSQMSEDLRESSQMKENLKQTNQRAGILQPFLELSGFNDGNRQTMMSSKSIAMEAAAAVAAASGGLIPPSVFLGSLPQLPMSGSASLIPPLFPLPPPLESTSLMPQLAGFLPPNFPSFVPPSSSISSEDSVEPIHPDSGHLAAAKAWLSTLSSLPGHTQMNGYSNGDRAPISSPMSNTSSTVSSNFAAMEDLLKSLPAMKGQGEETKAPLISPMPPEILSALVHKNPLVMSLFSRSQALLGFAPPPPGSSPIPTTPLPPLTSVPVTSSPPSIKSVTNNVDMTAGTAKRKRTRPVYIPPQMRAVKRSSVAGSPNALEIPEDLSMPRTAHQQQSQQNQEMGTTNGSLEKRLAYFLIQEMLPSEIIEGEGFKTLVNELLGPKASTIPRITARRMRMEILPQIANTVLPTSQEVNRSILAVEFWRGIAGKQNFANLTLGCGGQLLQTALLKSPTDAKKIIVDNVVSGEAILPKILVTNKPEDLRELLPPEFLIIPCFIRAFANAVTSGFQIPEVISILRILKESLGSCHNELSPNDSSLEAMTWREVSDLMAQSRVEQGQEEISHFRCLLEELGKTLDFVQRQESANRTASLIASILIDLKKIYLSINPEDSKLIKAFKTAVIEHLDGSYSSSDTLLIAGLIDPRVRSQVLQAAPHSVKLLKEKVEELSRQGDKEDMYSHTAHCEVDRYLREEITDDGQWNPLKWWNDRQSMYPLLSRLARHYLAIPLASFNTKLRLKPLRKSEEKGGLSGTLPDGLNLPNYCDIFAQLKMNLSAEDMLIYTFLWHNWSMPSGQ